MLKLVAEEQNHQECRFKIACRGFAAGFKSACLVQRQEMMGGERGDDV